MTRPLLAILMATKAKLSRNSIIQSANQVFSNSKFISKTNISKEMNFEIPEIEKTVGFRRKN